MASTTIKAQDMTTMIKALRLNSGEEIHFTFNAAKQGDISMSIATVVKGFSEIQTRCVSDGDEAFKACVAFSAFVSLAERLADYGKDIVIAKKEATLNLSISEDISIDIPLREDKEGYDITPSKEDFIAAIDLSVASFNALQKKGASAADTASSQEMGKVVTFTVEGERITADSLSGATIASCTEACKVAIHQRVEDGVVTAADNKASFSLNADTFKTVSALVAMSTKVRLMLAKASVMVGTDKAILIVPYATTKTVVQQFLPQFNKEHPACKFTTDAEELKKGVALLRVTSSKNTVVFIDCDGAVILKDENDNKVKLATSEIEGIAPRVALSAPLVEKALNALDKGNITISLFDSERIPTLFENGTVSEPKKDSSFYVLRVKTAEKAEESEESEDETEESAEE